MRPARTSMCSGSTRYSSRRTSTRRSGARVYATSAPQPPTGRAASATRSSVTRPPAMTLRMMARAWADRPAIAAASSRSPPEPCARRRSGGSPRRSPQPRTCHGVPAVLRASARAATRVVGAQGRPTTCASASAWTGRTSHAATRRPTTSSTLSATAASGAIMPENIVVGKDADDGRLPSKYAGSSAPAGATRLIRRDPDAVWLRVRARPSYRARVDDLTGARRGWREATGGRAACAPSRRRRRRGSRRQAGRRGREDASRA
jgi:hypothetical protein